LILVLLAAAAMVIQDVLSTCLVIAEARGHRIAAGLLDAAAWLAVITTTTVSVTALQSHDLDRKIIVVLAMTVANIAGTFSGVWIGERFVKDQSHLNIEARLTALEQAIGAKT
jgi:hypothetical protein